MTAAAQTTRLHRVGLWPRVARATLGAVLRLLFRMRLEGQPPSEGPYLLIANHQGWADAFLIIALFPIEPRIHFIADRTATMTVWWKRVLLRSLGIVVTVARDGSSERGAIAATLDLLEEGHVVALFPEGRVSRTELTVCPDCAKRGRDLSIDAARHEHHRELAPFARGVGYLALKAGVPVLPVWLQGTAELYLGRELVATAGALVPAPMGPLTKEATQVVADYLHDELARLARPWTEPTGPKRWRWLTHIL